MCLLPMEMAGIHLELRLGIHCISKVGDEGFSPDNSLWPRLCGSVDSVPSVVTSEEALPQRGGAATKSGRRFDSR
jgi:hypothetical protein